MEKMVETFFLSPAIKFALRAHSSRAKMEGTHQVVGFFDILALPLNSPFGLIPVGQHGWNEKHRQKAVFEFNTRVAGDGFEPSTAGL